MSISRLLAAPSWSSLSPELPKHILIASRYTEPDVVDRVDGRGFAKAKPDFPIEWGSGDKEKEERGDRSVQTAEIWSASQGRFVSGYDCARFDAFLLACASIDLGRLADALGFRRQDFRRYKTHAEIRAA